MIGISNTHSTQQAAALQGMGIGGLGSLQTNVQTATNNGVNFGPASQITLSQEAQNMIAQAQTQAQATTQATTAVSAANNTSATTATPAAAQANVASNTNATNQAFLNYANQSPAQRMYNQILSSLGLTQQQLNAMTPTQRAAVMAKIEQMIKQKIASETGVSGTGSTGVTASSTSVAAAAASLAPTAN